MTECPLVQCDSECGWQTTGGSYTTFTEVSLETEG